MSTTIPSKTIELNKDQKRSLTTIKKKIIATFTGEMTAQVDLIVAISKGLKSEVWNGISVRQLTSQLATLSIGKEQHKAGHKTVSKSTVHRYMRVSAMLTEAELDSSESVLELFNLNFTVSKLVEIDKGNTTVVEFLELVETVKGDASDKSRKAEINGVIETNKKETSTPKKKEEKEGSQIGETNQNGDVLNGISVDTLLTRIFRDVAEGKVPQEISSGSIDLVEAFNLAVIEVSMNVDNFITENITGLISSK